jgi:hypothetical protein
VLTVTGPFDYVMVRLITEGKPKFVFQVRHILLLKWPSACAEFIFRLISRTLTTFHMKDGGAMADLGHVWFAGTT